jgi:hypothetical protein
VPSKWEISRGEELYDRQNKAYGPAILAAVTDPVKWWTGYEESGLYIGASNSSELIDLEPDTLLQKFSVAPDNCGEGPITRYWKQPDEPNRGHKFIYRLWSKCGDKSINVVEFVAKPGNQQYVVVGLLTIANEGDWKVRERVFESLAVDPTQFRNGDKFPDSTPNSR